MTLTMMMVQSDAPGVLVTSGGVTSWMTPNASYVVDLNATFRRTKRSKASIKVALLIGNQVYDPTINVRLV